MMKYSSTGWAVLLSLLAFACSDRSERRGASGPTDAVWTSGDSSVVNLSDAETFVDANAPSDAGNTEAGLLDNDAAVPVTEHTDVAFADFLVRRSDLDETERLQIQAFFTQSAEVYVTGGAVVEPKQDVLLGSFTGSQSSWSFDESIASMSEVVPLNTGSGGGIWTLRARFYLSDGSRLERDFVLRLVCSVDAGQALCDGRCSPLANDLNNCGGCGRRCEGPNPRCEDGVCTPCPGSQVECGGRCVDVSSDEQNCGTCDKHCSGEGAKCALGRCTSCKSNELYCDGHCVDVLNNALSCGTCGKVCPGPDAGCQSGVCVTCASTPNAITCGSEQCVNADADTSNCGACAHHCHDYAAPPGYYVAPGTHCSIGVCKRTFELSGNVIWQTCAEACAQAGMQCDGNCTLSSFSCDCKAYAP